MEIRRGAWRYHQSGGLRMVLTTVVVILLLPLLIPILAVMALIVAVQEIPHYKQR